MGSCNIYNTEFVDDLKNIQSATIALSRLSSLIPPLNSLPLKASGIWFPLIYSPNNQPDFKLSNLLIRAKKQEYTDPYDCKIVEGNSRFEGEVVNNIINCNYCISDDIVPQATQWQLKIDSKVYNTYSSSCGTINVSKDIRANYDDVLPKIPSLNNSYITGFVDHKYINRFPATQKGFNTYDQAALGFEGFIKYSSNSSLKSFSSHPELRIDWKIGETMGEIPFNGEDTYHKDIDTHIKSYNRYTNTNKTCGNFIFLKPYQTGEESLLFYGLHNNSGDINKLKVDKFTIPFFSQEMFAKDAVPTEEDFTIPYGFTIPEVNNVFVGKKKDLSHWNWNHTSGILCWYRHSDINRIDDTRPIRGVDLYISEGDVFWAQNSGPETFDSDCPLGTKVTDGEKIKYVIPYGSEFIYISQTIYGKFLKILDRLEKIPEFISSLSINERINIAAIEATGPSYDEITLDLLKRYENRPETINPKTKKPFDKQNIFSYTENNSIVFSMDKLHDLLSTFSEPMTKYSKPNTRPSSYFNWINRNSEYGVPYGRNEIGMSQMLSKDNSNMSMSGLLNISGFVHIPSVSKLNYIYNKESLIKTLANKYGSHLFISKGTTSTIQINTISDNHHYFDLDFEMVTDESIPIARTRALNCSAARGQTIIGYNQSFDNNRLATALESEKRKDQSCTSGIFKILNTASMSNLYTQGLPISTKVVSTGAGTIFNDIYYKQSYDTAVLIDSEELCSRQFICDSGLYKKYVMSQYPNVVPLVFENKNKIVSRVYNGYIYNPNIDMAGFSSNGGIYYESNIFGKDIKFKPNDSSSQINPSLTFATTKTAIKIYNIQVNKLRSKDNLGCKTFPLDKACQCSPIVTIDQFPYKCSSSSNTHTNSAFFTPNLSTQGINIYTNGKSSPRDGSSLLAAINKYYDPENPFGGAECVRSDSISLPVYTTTTWQVSLPSYNYLFGSLWTSIGDSTKISQERNKIQAKIANLSVYNGQWREITSPQTSIPIELINPLNKALIGNQNLKLYQDLPCSLVGYDTPRMHTVSITFKYVPLKSMIHFKHSPIISMGTLSNASYTTYGIPGSLTTPGLSYDGASNTPIDYDSSTHTWSFRDEKFASITPNSTRVLGKITPQIYQLLEKLKLIKNNKKINLFIKSGSNWIKVHSSTFGYYLDEKPHLGYPMFYEYLSGTKMSMTQGFLKSFILRDPKFVYYLNNKNSYYLNSLYNYKIFPSNIFYNYINIEDIRSYFLVPSILTELQSQFPNDSALAARRNFIISNNFNLDLNIPNYNDGLDTILLREPCFYNVDFINIPNISSTILEKILFKKEDGRLYSSFRLIPFVTDSNGTTNFDASMLIGSFFNPITKLTSSEKLNSLTISRQTTTIGEIDRTISNSLYSHKWADVYGFERNFNSFDLTNRLIDSKLPQSLTYDNILYRLAQYNEYYLASKNLFLPFKNNLKFNQITKYNDVITNNSTVTNDKKLLTYLHSNENSKYRKEEKDYLYPFLDINYFDSINTFPHMSDPLLNNSGLVHGDIYYSGIKSVHPIYDTGNIYITGSTKLNPNYGSGYFWIDIPNNLTNIIKYESLSYLDPNNSILSKNFKCYDPNYILLNTFKTVEGSSNSSCDSIISPKLNNYTNTWKINSTNTNYTTAAYKTDPQYCNIDNVVGCSSNCSMSATNPVSSLATYSVDTTTTTRSTNLAGVDFALSVGDGSYHNFPYITRSTFNNNSSYNNIFPGKTPDGTIISNNQNTLPDDEYYLYSNQTNTINGTTEMLPLDNIVNEMLYRLYNGAEVPINIDYIGRKTQEQFNKQKKILALDNLIDGSSPVKPKDIYDLIPYDYDLSANRDNLKVNGSIQVYGIINIGDTNNITIGNTTINTTITSDSNAVSLTISANGSTYKTTIQQLVVRSTGLFAVASTENYNPNPMENQTISKVSSCESYSEASVSMSSYFSDTNINGVNIEGEYAKCMEAIKWFVAKNGYGTCNHTWMISAYAEENEGFEVNGLALQLLNSGPPCMPCGCLCWTCVDRGTIPFVASPGCTVISKISNGIIPGARGVYGGNQCIGGKSPPCLGSPRGAGPYGNDHDTGIANIDGLGGGFAPRSIATVGSNCGYNGCGPRCKPMDGSHTNFATYYYHNSLAPISPCECLPYNKGPCNQPRSGCAECHRREYTAITYNFQDGNYNYDNMRAHKYRDFPTTPYVGNVSAGGGEPLFANCEYGEWNFSPNNGANSATENCIWQKCPSTIYKHDIYQTIFTSIADINLPDCPIGLFSVDFDNNYIRVSAFGNTFCFPNQIRNNCPVLSATLANDNYYLTNNITSECSSCSVEDTSVKFTSSPVNQNWETVTEERMAIIGTITLGGEINQNVGGCCVGITDASNCGQGLGTTTCRDTASFGAGYQCGKSSPDSFPWGYCLVCPVGAAPQLHQQWGGSDIISYGYGGIVTDCIPFGFESAASNGAAAGVRMEEFKKSMQYFYKTVAPCHNNTSLNLADIIEGVVPGSCSLNFTTVSMPYLAFRRTFAASETQSGSAGVTVAYIRYRYKRPKTIEDIMLGNPRCGTYYNSGNTNLGAMLQIPNLLEKYINGDICQNEPTCLDTAGKQCDDNNYCCKTGR